MGPSFLALTSWNRRSRFRSAWSLVLSALVLAALLVTPALAEQHRARVAKSLVSALSARGGEDIQVLVQAPQDEIDRLAKSYGIRVVQRLEMGALLTGAAALFDDVANDAAVEALAGNEIVVSTMAVTTQSTGANQLWGDPRSNRYFNGATGAGIGVAILDSGIGAHSDVAKRVRLSLDFTRGDEAVADAYGHGTHIAGIVAGSGVGSKNSEGTAYVGMAPGADLISLKVLGADGTGEVVSVIRAIEWAIANRTRQKIRVLNLSLGHVATSSYRDDPLARAVERAVAAGLVVVSSAGNWGKTEDGTPIVGAIVSPGYTPGALTVGAMNTKKTVSRADDTMATYSSRGPVGNPDDPTTWEIKPDVVAPGNAIVSAGLAGTHLYDEYPDRRVTGENGGTYLTLSGASMATAVVSGAVAQLLQIRPEMTPAEVKFALQYTAERLEGFGLFDQGAGSINVALAAALVRDGYVSSAPTENTIAGETITGSGVAFGTAVPQVVGGDAFVWGSRGVGGNSLGGGNRDGVASNAFVWGSRGVNSNAFVWGSRGISGDAFVWGSRGISDSAFVWGGRGVGGNAFVWGSRGGVGSDAFVWGGRGISDNAFVWGGRGGVGGDAFVWGSRGVSGNAFVWGGRGGVGSDAFVWGGRGINDNAFVWGGRGGVGGDAFVWGSRGISGNAFVWGSRGGVGGDAFVWGSRGVSGNAFVWGSRGGVGSDAFVWGSRGVSGNAFVWGSRGGVGSDAFVWGSRGVGANAFVWGSRPVLSGSSSAGND